jgi:hypothetical protein
LFGNKKEEALELYQKGAVRALVAYQAPPPLEQQHHLHQHLHDTSMSLSLCSSSDLLQASQKVARSWRCISKMRGDDD